MDYSSLYRRMRPKNFDQIIGQDHITTALRNQVRSGKIGHAYLFSGTRGTGKTSTALVFAKAVNCLNPRDGNPCMTCASCLEENPLDTIEMDAASNNSVEDIRELREHVKFAPTSGRKKVYIIDEVHMLSAGAFNALLKTLEEPPAYVMFILATTETHKVPMTIQSRCQKFEFKRIASSGIRGLLRQTAGDLGVEISEAGIDAIAASSDGALRDSLAALEQCLSVSHGTVTEEDVHLVLGTVPQDDLLALLAGALQGSAAELLERLDAILAQGKDVVQLLSGAIDVTRDLIVSLITGDPGSSLIYGSEEYRSALGSTCRAVTLDGARALFAELVELSKHLRYSRNKRALLEVTLLRVAVTFSGSGAPLVPDFKPAARPVAGPEPKPQSKPALKPEPKPALKPSPTPESEPANQPEAKRAGETDSEPPAPPTSAPASKPASRSKTTSPAEPVSAPELAAAGVPESEPLRSAPPKPTRLTPDDELWPEALERLKQSNPSGWNLAKNSRVLIREGNLIKIGVENFNKLRQTTLNLKVKGELESILLGMTGNRYILEFEAVQAQPDTRAREIESVREYFRPSGDHVEIVDGNE